MKMWSIQMLKNYFGNDANEFIFKEAEKMFEQEIIKLDEFHEWIEKYDWQFNPIQLNGKIVYRWVNETFSSQATTKELYEIFIEQNEI